MKKNVLASSVAAALLGFGMVGAAHASNVLVVPYFTAQTEHATLLNIVNTDTVSGKAVKVRFRGAANSDDVFDFQIFLSPGDVWTGNISKGASGAAQLTTTDATCSKPAKAVLNATPFVTSRVDSTLSADGKAEQTREGYVEIFTMADIPPYLSGRAAGDSKDVNPLYTAVKHVDGIAPCSGSAWTGLDSTAVRTAIGASTFDKLVSATATDAQTIKGLALPTGGLMSNYTIVNVARAGAWDGEATAVEVGTVSTIPYWPQIATAAATPDLYTADPLFRTDTIKANGSVASSSASIAAGNYDLPDLSTPYGAGTAAAQAAAVTAALAVTSVSNEFLANADIQSTTDWVFSMPTRRYSVAFDYAATISATDDGRRFNPALEGIWFGVDNTAVSSRLICVSGVEASIRDQEERTVTVTTEVVVSPSNLPAKTLFCGEAGVLSVNGGAVKPTPTINASVAVTDIDVPYAAGWMTLTTPGATTANGLPVVGQSFSRAAAGDSFFAASWDHRAVGSTASYTLNP